MELAENKAITNQIQESASLPENKQKHWDYNRGKMRIEVSQREKKLRTESINDKREASAIKSTSKQTDQIRKVITWGKVQ